MGGFSMNNDFTLSFKATFKREEVKGLIREVTELFEEFLKKSNIDINDTENIMVILYNETLKIKERIYDKSYKTVRDITKAEGKLELIKKCIELSECK